MSRAALSSSSFPYKRFAPSSLLAYALPTVPNPSPLLPQAGSFRFARFSSSHLLGRSLSGQSVAIYRSRSLLKWVTGCQELIPVDQERQLACSWLDTLIACWRRASPRLLINNHPSRSPPPPPSQFFLKKPSPVWPPSSIS